MFINPSRAGQGNVPLNIPLLIRVLKTKNHEVVLFDFSDYDVFNDKSYEKIFFKDAAFENEKLQNDRKMFHGNKYGTEINGDNLKVSDYSDDFHELLLQFRPQAIGVSCLSADFLFITSFLLPYKIEFNIPIIFGGIQAILLPDETISVDACDIVCTGEGENVLPKLLDALSSGYALDDIEGIWFKRDGHIVKNPPAHLTDLQTLLPADFDLFDPIQFYRPFDGVRYKMINYEVSRGCPYNCSYCVNGILKDKYKGLGRYHRVKTALQSIDELTFLVDRYKFDFIRFWDEDFTSLNTSFLMEFSQLYIKRINLPFLIYARVESVTEEKVQLLRDMGCKTFAMGIESGNEYIRRHIMNRKMSNKTIIEKFAIVKNYGIRVSAYNMIGLPQETREAIFDTIEINRTVNPDSFSVTLLEPYKGTPIRVYCEQEGLDPQKEATFTGKVPTFVPRSMTQEELSGLFRTFPLYVRFPRARFDEIRAAEQDNTVYERLIAEFGDFK